ncbi:hypothetical protein [Methylobacterium sp. WL6]|uniref:hypothetical protein n=1 Tax=Methylobacterium sp. WL6 TaxID=2603901 RepID=UPI0011C90895|nr:hypothetical protein [Methylobacterium sp. WL6]TXN73434.1 hypothetical protein FV230_01300 [Methylobacterium sp. WL6]
MPTNSEYQAARDLARELVQLDLRTPGLRLTGIGSDAIKATLRWERPPRLVSWDWFKVIKRRHGGYLELAVWHDETLCGLAYGPAGDRWLSIERLEGNPYPHPLKGRVTDIAIAVMQTQAVAMDLPQTRISDPFEELIPHYRRRGYVNLVKSVDSRYLTKGRGAP